MHHQTCFTSLQQPLPVITEKPPIEKTPQNRLVKCGPGALSDSELLSIFLEKQSDGNPAIVAGRKLIQKFGGLSELGGLSIQQLCKESGMTTKNAVRLLSIFEFATRCANEKMHQTAMNSSEAIYQAMAPRLAHKKVEYVFLILLNTKLQATQTIELSKGNTVTALCEPRDVLHHVLINKSTGFVMVHNHPSGDPSPSRQDLILTKRLQECSEQMHIRFVDHVIIGRPGADRPKAYYSFTEAGVI